MGMPFSDKPNTCAGKGFSAHSAATGPLNVSLLRYLLALSIVAHHVNALTGRSWPMLFNARMVVSLFLLLSGYYAFQSWQRRPCARHYVLHRLRRLLPAYWVVVSVGAVALCAVSALGPADYFTSAQWWRYLACNLCLLNFLQPDLPGVFSSLPFTAVNGALWYVKIEVLLTFLVPLLNYVGRFVPLAVRMRKHGTPLSGFSAAVLWVIVTAGLCGYILLASAPSSTVVRYLTYPQLFLTGYLMSAFSGYLTRGYGAVVAAVCGIVPSVLFPVLFDAFGYAALCLLVVYITLFIDLPGINRLRPVLSTNLTYSLYLCHFPLLQLGATLTQGTKGVILGLALTALVTPLLYYGVERPWARAHRAEKGGFSDTNITPPHINM